MSSLPSRSTRAALVFAWLCLALTAGPARAVNVTVSMAAPGAGCAPVTSGVRECIVLPDTTVVVTWAMSSQQSLIGYGLEIRWDAAELTLLDATPLYADTGSPVAFLEAPNDPDDSRATAINEPSFVPLPTTTLFQLTFSVTPAEDPGAGPDLWWFPDGSGGLSPSSVVIQNASGAAYDFVGPSVPAGGLVSRWVLGGSLLTLGFGASRAAWGRSVPGRGPRPLG